MHRLLLFCALCLAAVPALAQPRAAYVYSSFRDGQYWYRDEQLPLVKDLGWHGDGYENTKVADLLGRIDQYAVVICNSSFNYSNPQDLGAQGARWRQYIAAGGCLVATDANYAPHFGWLQAIDPSLRWESRGELNRWAEGPPRWTATNHPLLRGVEAPRVSWTNPSIWSDALTPLASDTGRRPVVAYREIGKGIVVISSAYRQYGFPSAPFLANLAAWAADPARQAAVAAREQAPVPAVPPGLTVPTLSHEPTIDGRPSSAAEWRGAATLPQLVGPDGAPVAGQSDAVKVAHFGGDLCVAFDCHDGPPAPSRLQSARRDGILWAEDDLEIDLQAPSGACYRFVVAASGARCDDRDGDAGWDGCWQAATKRDADGWSAEVRIPLAPLSSGGSTAGWRANFCRRKQQAEGAAASVTAWSAVVTSATDAARFAPLSLPGLPMGGPQAEMTVAPPKSWFVGRNTVEVTVSGADKRSVAADLLCVDDLTGRPIARQALRLGAKTTARVPIDLWSGSERSLQLVLVDRAAPHRVLTCSQVINATPAPLMQATLLYPSYRGLVQSRDPQKRLHLQARIGVAAGLRMRLTASLAPAKGGAPIWRVARPAAGGVVDLGTSLASLKVGQYAARIELSNDTGRVLASQSWPVRVLPPAASEITFDERHICYLDGKPFFPLGIMHISEPVVGLINKRAAELGLPTISVPSLLEDVKAHGFNCVVRGWGMPSEDYLRKTDELGLWVMPEVGAPKGDELARLVEQANRHKSVLLWYGVDEPSGDKLAAAIDAHKRFEAADIRRPVSAACNNPAFLEGAAQAYDLIMMDLYIVGSGSYAEYRNWVRQGLAAGGGGKAVWMVPQAFAIDGPFKEPTPEEVRCQAYVSIVHGATGLVWYAYYTTEPYTKNPRGRDQWFIPDTPLWPAFAKLNAEIAELTPTLVEGARVAGAASTSDAVHVQVWARGVGRTLIAVNVTDKPVRCALSGLSGGAAQVLFEGRTAVLAGGSLVEEFKPYEAHVYRWRAAR